MPPCAPSPDGDTGAQIVVVSGWDSNPARAPPVRRTPGAGLCRDPDPGRESGGRCPPRAWLSQGSPETGKEGATGIAFDRKGSSERASCASHTVNRHQTQISASGPRDAPTLEGTSSEPSALPSPRVYCRFLHLFFPPLTQSVSNLKQCLQKTRKICFLSQRQLGE